VTKLSTTEPEAAPAISQEERQLLKSRALQLAAKPAATGIVAKTELISFLLGEQEYAFEKQLVGAIYTAKNVYPVPNTPLFIEGVMNIHGQLVAVVNLRVFLQCQPGNISRTTRQKAIVIDSAFTDMKVALLVDNILAAVSVSTSDLTDSMEGFDSQRAKYAKGVVENLVVLDLERILADRNLVVGDTCESE
jgi:purine-binding chemotaxis protein CheW